jgi:hypothetical protein
VRLWWLLFALSCHRPDPQPRAQELHVDVPRLAAIDGTLALDPDPIVDVTALPAQLVTVPVIAIDRHQLALQALADLRTRGAARLRLVVLAADSRRMIEIEAPRALNSGDSTTIAVLHIGSSALAVNETPTAPAELRTRIGKVDGIATEIDPDVTVQRLAEIVALLGGDLVMVPPPALPRRAP